MNARSRIMITLAALLASVCCVASGLAQDSGQASLPQSPMTPVEPLALFTPNAENRTDPEAGEPYVLRSRMVRLDVHELTKLNPVDGKMHRIQLFEDVEVVATCKRTRSLDDGAVTWTGSLDDHPYSSFVFAVVDGVIVGQFRSITRGTFSVRYLGDGIQVIRELNPSQMGDCGGAVPVPSAGSGDDKDRTLDPMENESGALLDDGSVIDLLVAYTPAARSSEGGTVAMRALIAASIEDVNLRHSNSATNVQFRLVHQGEVSYAESGNSSTDLAALADSDDGAADIVHTWRNQYGADVVTMIEDSMESGTAGLGYRPANATQLAYAGNAFSVVLRTYADSGTMAHEIGHNLGCHHHPDDNNASADATIYPYAFGHRFYAGWWFRTTMAYDPDGFHVRIDYFSDPDNTYNEVSMGTEGARDNAEVIRLTRTTVANHRQSVYPDGATFLNFTGVCPCDGTLLNPHVLLIAALSATPANGTIAIFSGTSSWTGTINQPVTLSRWGSGTVQIGP